MEPVRYQDGSEINIVWLSGGAVNNNRSIRAVGVLSCVVRVIPGAAVCVCAEFVCVRSARDLISLYHSRQPPGHLPWRNWTLRNPRYTVVVRGPILEKAAARQLPRLRCTSV